MLIEQYELELFTPHCSPGSESFAATAHLVADIREVLPYLNATLPGAHYSPQAPALTWRDGARHTAFRSHEISASNLEDRDDAVAVLEGLIGMVNETFEKRAEIEPDHTAHRRPTPLTVLALLPRTDCGECGLASCYMFAVKVAAGHAAPEDCPPLLEPAQARRLADLQSIAGHATAIE